MNMRWRCRKKQNQAQ